MSRTSGKPILGLMGGIGSGKSTVARQFAQLGCGVIDADRIAHEVLQQEPVKQTLVQWWGPGMLDAAGQVDRAAVGRLVFDDPAKLRQLESLTHPRIHQRRHELREQMQQDPDVVAIVEDCPLLLEKQLDAECDFLIFVAASLQTRLQRVRTSRGWSQAELVRREKNQLGLDIKAKLADYVIDNDADEADCLLHVRRVLSQILQIQIESPG